MKILNSILKMINIGNEKATAKEVEVKDPDEKDLEKIIAKNKIPCDDPRRCHSY